MQHASPGRCNSDGSSLERGSTLTRTAGEHRVKKRKGQQELGRGNSVDILEAAIDELSFLWRGNSTEPTLIMAPVSFQSNCITRALHAMTPGKPIPSVIR